MGACRGGALLKLLNQFVWGEVEGCDLVSPHPLEEEGERDSRKLGGFGERESPLSDLFEEPQLSELSRQLVRLPLVMGERLGRQLDLDPAAGGALHLAKNHLSGHVGAQSLPGEVPGS